MMYSKGGGWRERVKMRHSLFTKINEVGGGGGVNASCLIFFIHKSCLRLYQEFNNLNSIFSTTISRRAQHSPMIQRE